MPIGVLAAGQTILMLTGGIDLSAAMIATGAAYVAANQSPEGAVFAIAAGLLVGVIAGAANGVGVGVFRVNPLIMTLAMSAILLGLFTSWAQTIFSGSTRMGDFIRTLGGGSFFDRTDPVGGGRVGGALGVLSSSCSAEAASGETCMPSVTTPSHRGCRGSGHGKCCSPSTRSPASSAPSPAFCSAAESARSTCNSPASFLLPSVAAAVIGGTSIFGGVGTYTGTILGALILGVLQSLLTFLGAGQAVQQMLYGSIVIGLSWLYTRIAATQ